MTTTTSLATVPQRDAVVNESGMLRQPLRAARLAARPSAAIEQLSYAALVWFVGCHLVALVLLPAFLSWKIYWVALGLHSIFGVSITLGAHRYFSHKAFVAPTWLENLIAITYTLSMDRCGEGLISWAAGHKFHHAYPDDTLDPHSPVRGYWHAYCGHYIYRRKDLYAFEDYRHYRPDLAAKPTLVWLDKRSHIWALQALWIALLFVLGGLWSSLPGFDWHQAMGFLVGCVAGRYVFTQASHSFVDTLSHGVGPFKSLPDVYHTRTHAKNNLSYWFMTFGNETWHNTHHAYPRAANNGSKWYHWDFDSFAMKTLARLGLISGLRFVPDASAKRGGPAAASSLAKRLPRNAPALADGCRHFTHQNEMPADLVAKIERLSFEHGGSYDSYLVNEPNREYFLGSDGESVVGFVSRGRYLNVIGGLIAAQDRKAALLADLARFARQSRKTLSVFSVADADVSLFRAEGFQVTKFGEDFVVDLKATSWKSKDFSWVRRQTSYAARHGVVMREARRQDYDGPGWQRLIGELEALENELLATKPQARPTAVFQGQLDQGRLGRRRLFVAFGSRGDGQAEGFVVLNPYADGRRWAVEIFRHSVGAVRGVAPALIHHAMAQLQLEDVEEVSLSIIPGIGCEAALPGDSALCRNLMQFWSKNLNFISDMRGVYHFKTRFRPLRRNTYVCVTPKVTPGSIFAFLMVWGILKVKPVALLKSLWHMLVMRRQRAALAQLDGTETQSEEKRS